MKYFGLNISNCIIGLSNAISKGRYVADLAEPQPMFEGKVACLQRRIGREAYPLLGIGDSMNDFGMLNYARIRAVVDRGNELAEHAVGNKWFVMGR